MKLENKKSIKHRTSYLKVLIPLLLLNLLNIVGFSQDLYYEQFTEVDGLPSLMTYEMVQDSNGLLWVGTENGLVSYDGDNFKRYSHTDLIDNDIIEISLDKNGRIYFLNLSGQLSFVEEDIVEVINTDSIRGKITEVISTEKKNFAAIYFQGETSRKLDIYEFSQNSKGQFCFEKSDKTHFLFKNKKYYPFIFDRIKSTLYSDSLILVLNPIKEGDIFETKDNGCFHVNSNRNFVKTDCSLGRLSEQEIIKRITAYESKNFAFLDKGVLIYDSNSHKSHTILKNIQLNTAFVDSERNVWISTPNDGLIKIPYINLQLESEEVNFVGDYDVNDIIHDDLGNIYIGTTTGQVLFFSNERKFIKNVVVSSESKPVFFHMTKHDIFGIANKSLFKIDRHSKNIDIKKHERIGLKSILVEKDSIYIGSRFTSYFVKYDDFESLDLNLKNGLIDHWINSIYKEQLSNTIYFGTTTGLFIKDNLDTFNPIGIKVLTECSISCIIGGNENSVWLGTRNLGAFRIKGDSIIERFDTSNGLVSNNINRLKILNDQLIVSTVEGVSIKNLKTREVNNITELSGVVSKEIFVCDIIDGEYWLGSNSGLSIIKQNQLSNFKNNGPTLSIKSFYANGVRVEYEENIQFSHDVKTILINLRNVSLRMRKNKSIKYKINSTDSSWVYSSDPLIRLQSLKYGKYRVQAVGLNSRKEEGNMVEFSFNINPPWWQTWWARIIGVILLLIGIQLVNGLRTKRIRKEEEIKRGYLTQINSIKDQALQLQMNPHFIFNSLNAIQGFIGTEEEKMAMNYLARFARLIRLIFEHSKGNTITLEEELEFINLYLDLEKLRFNDKVKIKISIDPEIQNIKDIIHVPPLLIQPIVENSFKHGLFHKKGNGNLSIDYTLQNNILKVTIQDDGIGRVKSNKISQNNIEKQTSSGIKTTLERIHLLNFGKDKKMNSVEIIDLYDAEGNAIGTKTTLNLSVKD